MKAVRDVLRKAPVWVNPDHTVETAVILMRGYDIGALPVLDGNRLVGIASTASLLGIDPSRRISEVMSPDVASVSSSASVREAAELMARSRVGRLAVVDGDVLVGMVTDGDLLPEVGRSYDPLTQLPWSDTLREWAIDRLGAGQEITVLFIDLDQFGQFNKLYGHIIGDEVLKAIADLLVELCDPTLDLVCRYGGDEFCVATLRQVDEASNLAGVIARRVNEIDIPELKGKRVTCTVGQYGGKRTKEREYVHYAATLNNLINLASQKATAGKSQTIDESVGLAGIVNEGSASAKQSPDLALSRIDIRWMEKTARVQVVLIAGSPGSETVERLTSTTTAETDEEGVLRLVAETTVSALRGVLPEGCDLTLADVIMNRMTSGETIITAVGRFTSEDESVPLAGSAVVGEDANRAAAEAVLASAGAVLRAYTK